MVATERTLPRRRIINTATAFHNKYVKHWSHESQRNAEACRVIPTRFQQLERRLQTSSERKGDELVQKVKDLFHNGMGIKWGDDQIRVFQAFIASCLPLIYGSTWAEEKTRVLEEWGLKRENMFSLVNMARRNGKTFVTSGTAAALLLCVPGIKLAIFSTCKRTSQMMMEAIMEMLDRAFDRGTHVSREDFVLVMKNTEAVCFKGPDGSKRLLSSLPGSVRVRIFLFFPFFLNCAPGKFFFKKGFLSKENLAFNFYLNNSLLSVFAFHDRFFLGESCMGTQYRVRDSCFNSFTTISS